MGKATSEVDCLAFCGSNQPLEPPAFVLNFCTTSRPRAKPFDTALVVGREHRKVVEHGSECGTSIAPRFERKPRLPGFMGYMFSDIRHHERDAQPFAVIRPATQTGEAVGYATAVLRSESTIVNWADTAERERFIEERNVVADSV